MADINPANTIPELDLKGYRITPKFEEWRRLYLDKTNKETFGNATQSALQAYNLDRETQYAVARQIGSDNISKYHNLESMVRDYLDTNGFTLPTLIAHALQQMTDPKVKTTHWWKEILILAGYKKEKGDIIVNNNMQANTQVNVDSSQIIDWNNKFREFLKQESSK